MFNHIHVQVIQLNINFMDSKEALAIEKKKRKAVAKKRICWFLGVVDLSLVIYIAVQIILLLQLSK